MRVNSSFMRSIYPEKNDFSGEKAQAILGKRRVIFGNTNGRIL
jgi:hypothetical protein